MAFLQDGDLNPFDDIGSMSISGGIIPGAMSKKKPRKIDQLTMGEIMEFMKQGRERGEGLTGAKSEDIGKKRGEIRKQYEDIVNAPSRGAERTAQARNADLKRLRQSQSQSGTGGGMARLQEAQMSQDYAGKIGDVRQKEYLDALNKLEAQYRGAASDVMGAEGQYAAISVGAKPTPQLQSDGGITYICTELNKRGFVKRSELFIIHLLLVFGTIFRPAQTWFYLVHGKRLVANMRKELKDIEWLFIKNILFTGSMDYMKELKFFKAMDNYERVVRNLCGFYGLQKELYELDTRWSFDKLVKSFKIMWRIA